MNDLGSLVRNETGFAGRMAFDDASRLDAADDFGHIVHRLPAAVVTPASIEDVVKIVQLANRLDAKIAMNGNGYLFRTARDADGAWNSTMLATNRSLYERARTAGGKQYPVTAMPFTTQDWKDHFGPETWQFLRRAKQRFDPRNVLTPGPGIFASSSVDALLPPVGGSRTPVA